MTTLKPYKPKVNSIKTILDNFNPEDINKTIKLNGWIKTYRNQQTLYFMGINDGCQCVP